MRQNMSNQSGRFDSYRVANERQGMGQTRNLEGITVKETDLENDQNYKAAYRDYQFISKFIMTQMFVSLVESKAII